MDECLFATNYRGLIKTKLNSRITGSAALDLAYVGAGRFDGYFQDNLNIWDIAAGILIIKEAGGVLNEINLSQRTNLKLLASSHNIREKMIKNINNF